MKTFLFTLYGYLFFALPLSASVSILPETGCDTLITRNGNILLVHVKSINKTDIRYTRCGDNPNGGLFAMNITDIKAVRLASNTLPGEERAVYRAFIRTKTGNKAFSGYLYSTTDSSIQLVRLSRKTFDNQQYKLDIPVNEIARIQIQRKGQVGRSFLTGVGIGSGASALIGYISGDDPKGRFFSFTREDKAFFGLIFGGLLGGLFGLFAGFITRRVPFDGNPANYPIFRSFVQQYTITGR